MFPLVPPLKWVRHPLVAKFPSQGTISVSDHWTLLNVSIRPWEFQSHKGKEERTGQDVWFRLSLFLKLCMLAHQTLVCIYLCTTVLIAIVHVLWWESERDSRGWIRKGVFYQVWPDFSCDHVIMCFWHRRVVLLTRSSWMLIKMNDYYNTFCVACWMNLHVNCRPI